MFGTELSRYLADDVLYTPSNYIASMEAIESKYKENPHDTEALEYIRDSISMVRSGIDQVKYAYNDELGMEGLGAEIAKALTGLANITLHIANLMKTFLFNGLRDFKRSDLAAYNDSNRVTMTRIYSSDNYGHLYDLNMYIPKGMVGKYTTSFYALDNFLNKLDMKSTSARMVSMIETIMNDVKVSRQKNILTEYYSERRFKDTKKNMESDYAKVCKCFTTSSVDRQLFPQSFNSMSEFERVVKDCIDAQHHFKDASACYDNMKKMEEHINSLIDYSERMTKNQVNELADIVRAFAEMFEMYSAGVNDLLRLDHNLVEVIKQIRSKLNV